MTRTLVTGIEKERPRTDSSVEASVRVAKERIPANRGVPDATGEALKGVGTSCRVEARIAAVRRWDNRLRLLWKCKAGEQERGEKQTAPLK